MSDPGAGVLARVEPRVAGVVPPAPDYDAGLEEKEYSRSLLSPDDLAALKAEIAIDGPMNIAQVRGFVQQNSVKESQESRGETFAIDPETLMVLDARTEICVFIAGDNVYSREQLLEHYPFEALGVAPEAVFAQQEVGVFVQKDEDNEYVARDVGDSEEFTLVEDLVKQATHRGYKSQRSPARVVKTKIFLGKESWEDFTKLKSLARAFSTFVVPLALGPAGSAGALECFLGGVPAPVPRRLEAASLDSGEAAAAQDHKDLLVLERRTQALQAREAALAEREAALDRALGVADESA